MSSIESVMHETRIFAPSEALQKNAAVKGMAAYQALCKKADEDYEGFWADLANELLDWKKPFSKTLDESKAPFYKWFGDGELNVSYNCLDRHLAKRGNQTAIIFEADDGSVTHVSYQELYHHDDLNNACAKKIKEGLLCNLRN